MSSQPATVAHEEWRPCPDAEGFYEISDLGRLRRIARARKARPGQILRPSVNNKGYPQPLLSCGPGRRFRRYLHVLVARAFLGEPPPGLEVNHKDSDRTNAAVSNLEWVTRSANTLHAAEKGRTRLRYVSPQVAAAVLESRRSGSNARAAREAGISRNTASRIACGRHWTTRLPAETR